MEENMIWEQEKKYMQKVIDLQDEVIASQQKRIHLMDTPEGTKLDDATGREWNLLSALEHAKRDNKALRELCEDLRTLARRVGQGEILKYFGAKSLDGKERG